MPATQETAAPKKIKLVSKTATKTPPAKTSARAATTSTDSGEKKQRAGRYKGKTSGLGVQAFQVKTLDDNFKNKLTDEQLAKAWRDEFPQAVKFSDKTVRVVRSRYNKGIHGPQEGEPKRTSRPFDEDGTELSLRGEGSKGRETESAPAGNGKAAAKVRRK